MEFNTLVKSHLSPILQNCGFQLVEETKNILLFQSPAMEVNIVFNEYDKSHLIEIGRRGGTLYPLNNNAVKNILGSILPIEQITIEEFIKNIAILFEQSEGGRLLKGDITPLKLFIERESEDYTLALVRKQTLETASKAWERNDFETFVRSIDEVGVDNLPQSFKLKYKIAKQKL
jgi:hypothetical protein